MDFDAQDEVTALARRLVRTPSENPPGRESAVAEVLAGQARAWGLEVTTQEIDDNRVNVVTRLPGTGSAPSLVYCGHLDTVPVGARRDWAEDPFGGVVRDGYLWGRGAVDMKGGLAAMLTSLAVLRFAGTELPGDLVLCAVVGEEADCAGSRHLDGTDVLDDAGWLVVGEPTDLDLVVAHKGAVRVELVAHGMSAHGATPELGVNAIEAVARLVSAVRVLPADVRPHPLLGSPSSSVNLIEGGTAVNVVPDLCRAVVDVRTIPGVDADVVLASVKEGADRVMAAMPEVEILVRVLHERAPVSTSVDHPLVRASQEAAVRTLGGRRPTRGVPYFSDASVLSPPRNLPTVLFGPGEEALMHKANERVSTTDLHRATRFLSVLPTVLHGPDTGLPGGSAVGA
ncbi:M20 family metallopeptidase [Umezawaea tangerina]|uniref:Succinyl-diaminopimelate desuccinylase n=1 Tax=Umezawaea tangerina TaxID=84725 RepID=A0A2T0SU51_9PSEU|nr:M20 family metallopeptidase [Umezawaea tangerina]PRY36928.1 succinyl-diaminopimelate desuccinylase [Umezawaea tangerina]